VVLEQATGYGIFDGNHTQYTAVFAHGSKHIFECFASQYFNFFTLEVMVCHYIVVRARNALYGYLLHIIFCVRIPALRQKIFAAGSKSIQEHAGFETTDSVHQVGRNVKTVSGGHNGALPLDIHFEFAADAKRRLGMRMLVCRSDAAFFEGNFYHHNVLVVTKDLSFNSPAQIGPG
jgi:hypothetical protein